MGFNSAFKGLNDYANECYTLPGKVRYSAPLHRHRGSVQAVRPIGGVEV